jgi:aspartate aminotransferase
MAATAFDASVVPQAPEDALFGLMAAYRRDTDSNKVDLGIGAYRDNNAKPWVLPVVKKVGALAIATDSCLLIIYDRPTRSCVRIPTSTTSTCPLPVCQISQQRPRSSSSVVTAPLSRKSECVALPTMTWHIADGAQVTSLQTISGTGAVHLGALFLQKFYKPSTERTAYFSDPTWPNHFQIFSNVGLQHKTYPYFSKKTKGLDFDGMHGALESAPEGSIVVLHACAHNPTGVDATQDQWKKIAEVIRAKKHFPFFDTAYQGFASGDLAKDGWAIRYFVEQGFELCIAQSYAKNFGLYGERAGCFHFVTSPSSDAQSTVTRVASQLAILQRSEISNPPAYGARIASTVLNDPQLFSEWEANLREMSGRIKEMRSALRNKLEELGTPGTWSHITDQIGMFSFTGLTEEQVMKLREDSHVYMTKNGRISMAGLNTNNVEYFAKAVDQAVRATQ